MHNLLRVLLGIFTAALSRITDADPIATQHKPLRQKTILYLSYITDYILISQCQVHTPRVIQSIRDYVENVHKHKEVFVMFHERKSVKNAA